MRNDSLMKLDFAGLSRSSPGGDVKTALAAAANATGIDFAYLAAGASLESSLDPNAKAKTSSAAGLFQFIESTWSGMVERHGAKVGLAKEAAALAGGDVSAVERRRIMDLRYDPDIAARMGAEFAAENRDHLRQSIGREPEDVDLYLAHFLGAGGASKFLGKLDAAPNAAAARAFPAAAKANPSIFYDGDRARSFSEIRGRFETKLAARAGDIGLIAERQAGPASLAPAPAPFANSGAKIVSLAAARERPQAIAGDPYFTTLVTAQLSMNDSLARVRSPDQRPDSAYRGLL